MVGDPTALEDDLQESLKKLVESSKDNTGLNFQIAINYGSRDEIVRAIRKVAADCVDGQLKPEEITEERFSGYLDTIRSFILPRYRGRHLRKRSWRRRSKNTTKETADMAV